MLYKYLPYFLFKPLFGDRKKWGLITKKEDSEYQEWMKRCYQFYDETQKNSLGSRVNHLGFKIMRNVDLNNKRVLEIGPGIIEHLNYTKTRPDSYILADIRKEYLELSKKRLSHYNVTDIELVQINDLTIPLENDSVDIIITFHQLEHIHELDAYLLELKRVLKKDGLIVGAVPTEGGLAWGLGRFLTTRRYAKNQLNIDYDKIICWEHPSFVNKVKSTLDKHFTNIQSSKKPFAFLPFDCNLSWSFIYGNNK